jgi:superfamily I DNA/RNA helicase
MPLPRPVGRQADAVYLPARGHTVVLGTAGSGKTVMAIHRAAHLAHPGTDHHGRTLLLTFNNALVSYLRHLSGAALGSVTAETYHRFARGYLSSRGLLGHHSILNRRTDVIATSMGAVARQGVTDAVLSRSTEFFEDEFTWINSHGIDDERGYVDAERVGRTARAARAQRPAIWRVFKEYRRRRHSMGYRYDWDDLPAAVISTFATDTAPRLYKHIVIDEGQDFSPQMLRSIVAAAPNDGSVTYFGDTAQQIYGQRMSWRNAGLSVQPRDIIEFRQNYRNTRAIAALALAIAEMPFYAGTTDIVAPQEPRAEGPKPTIVQFDNEADEAEFVAGRAIAAAATQSVAILVRRREDEELIEKHLPTNRVRLHRKMPRWRTGNGIRYGTFHSAKGLEFDQVFLPFMSLARMPSTGDRAAFGDDEASSRDGRLLYVGVTRSKYGLVISYTGDPSPLLPPDHTLYTKVTRR